MGPEKVIATAIKERGMTIKAVSERTGIQYSHLQTSLKGTRELRALEYILLCAYFNINPLTGEAS